MLERRGSDARRIISNGVMAVSRGRTMALVIPWLLEREYQQHRNLDYYGLPKTFSSS